MKLEDLTTIDQLVDFLSGTQAVAFSVISDKDTCYRWIQGELVRFRYLRLSSRGEGVVIRYLMKISGYSRQQLTRLIAQYCKTGRLRRRQRTVAGFKPRYTEQDMGRYANAKNLLSQSARFLLEPDEAKKTIDEMEQNVKNKWYDIARREGVTEKECEKIASAFAYPGFRLEIPARL